MSGYGGYNDSGDNGGGYNNRGGNNNSGYDGRNQGYGYSSSYNEGGGYGAGQGSGYGGGRGRGSNDGYGPSGYGGNYGGGSSYGSTSGYGSQGYGGQGYNVSGGSGYSGGDYGYGGQSIGYGGGDYGYNSAGSSGYGGGTSSGYGDNYGDNTGGYSGSYYSSTGADRGYKGYGESIPGGRTGYNTGYGGGGYGGQGEYGGQRSYGGEQVGYSGQGGYASSQGRYNTGYGSQGGYGSAQPGYGSSSGGRNRSRSRSRERNQAGYSSYGVERDRDDRYAGRGSDRGYGSRGGRCGGAARGGGGRGQPPMGPGAGTLLGSGYEATPDNINEKDLPVWKGGNFSLLTEEIDDDKSIVICKRPGVGKNGKEITITSNYFRIHMDKRSKEFFKYHCDVISNRPSPDSKYGPSKKENTETTDTAKPARPLKKAKVRQVLNAMLLQHETTFKNVTAVHDGMAALYTTGTLGNDNIEFTDITLHLEQSRETQETKKRGGTYTVKLKLVETISATDLLDFLSTPGKKVPHTALQALDVALRHLSNQKFVSKGRNLFSMLNSKRINPVIDLCWGYHQSVRPADNNLLLNLDVTTSLFYASCHAHELVKNILGRRDVRDLGNLSERDKRKINSSIKKLEFEFTHRKQALPRACFSIDDVPTNQRFFERKDKDGNVIRESVADYFRKRYNIRLEYPFLPCLGFGSKQKPNWVPMEVCKLLPGQKCMDNDSCIADVIRETNKKPDSRARLINDQYRQNSYGNDYNVKGFGVSIESRMIELKARTLDTPTIQYANCSETPRNGAWNLRDKRFIDGATIESWGIVNLSGCPEDKVQSFVRALCDSASRSDIKILSNRPPIVDHRSMNTYGGPGPIMQRCVEECIRIFRCNPQIILVIKSDSSTSEYAEIKRMSDTSLGVPSQCVIAKNVQNARPQYCANLLLKINMKLGGKNSYVSTHIPIVYDVPTIVIGAQIGHPRNGIGRGPGIASLVASLDKYGCKHAARVSAQKGSNIDNIQELPNMLCDLLLEFYRNSHRKPERILYYRDGIGEGNYENILLSEIKALQKACLSMSPDYRPPITFIVVTKRHHTRCFAVNNMDTDKSGNLLPGTIIDNTITHPHYYDFFLYGHSGIQGTSVPARYTILFDENKLPPDEIQKITYSLCFNFQRCTRSVSVIAAVYYAELLATRARMFVQDNFDRTSAVSGSSSSSNYELTKIHESLHNVMFYV